MQTLCNLLYQLRLTELHFVLQINERVNYQFAFSQNSVYCEEDIE